MTRTITVMLALCLMVSLAALPACTDYGEGNCITKVDTTGDVTDVNGGCADTPLGPEIPVNLCSESGTDVHDDTCTQNGGTRNCVPCEEVQ